MPLAHVFRLLLMALLHCLICLRSASSLRLSGKACVLSLLLQGKRLPLLLLPGTEVELLAGVILL